MSALAIDSSQEHQFIELIQQTIQTQQFERLILSQYKGTEAELEKITFRLVELQQQTKLSVLYHYKTKDVTKNYDLNESFEIIEEFVLLCKQANLFALNVEAQLKKNKKKAVLNIQPLNKLESNHLKPAHQQHDREKERYIDQGSPFLHYLGITESGGNIIPAMARKWKQINKFIEIFSHAYEQIEIKKDQINIVDFGSGKGYLTFALYDYLQQQTMTQPVITGVELRSNLVEFCEDVAKRSGFDHLNFFEGDVRTYHTDQLDVMIALHACDIATDFAIHTGIRLNASMIMCAPCCHKELRPQLQSPAVLKPMLQFGVHAGQQAEMLTDSLRALFLKAYGYEVKVFEFVSLEHTSKNKMILATKRKNMQQPDAQILQQIQALKQMYGIEKQTLELLLSDQLMIDNVGCKC
ncbi:MULTISPECIES: class I SAM-dependent methyltransferase [unclassified Acinetobacter]|uniref:class I SAM-dependent methyltransferase n=1 Tax=unclassified Acinetobacter TaxID=196816 RepID=UPI00190D265F|nr:MULTISPECIES: SAM-dependent methyltransferase [unclassified Acinetobacter]MBK0064397.1 SAM-dependent methyltransferase [Acinetobacter sp. S55]MBK0067798.1 SAM-dependent methyltransferase [Acinetobacter sp. S54]